ncbi:MAG: hypothetical protein ACR2OZ_03835 [Verrucomicrobiales bacterium]
MKYSVLLTLLYLNRLLVRRWCFNATIFVLSGMLVHAQVPVPPRQPLTPSLTTQPATEPPQLVKPTDEEISAAFLSNPTEQAQAAFDAYKAGKFEDARKRAEALAKEGDINGMYVLALCHQFGRGGQPSLPEAERWFRQAAEKGHTAARTSLALLLYSTSGNDKDRLGEAIRLLRESAADDAPRVSMVLGELYARGIGVTTDFVEADRYFDSAIKAGQIRGWLAKGLLHGGAFGFEKQKSETKAEEFLKKGAEAGLADAMIMLGQRKLSASKGTDPLFDEGLKWLEKAGEKGSGEAYVALGALYEEGRLVKKDLLKAFAFYQKGADLGHAPAITKLGYCYENGLGVEKDAEKAFLNYKAAADRGFATAVYNVAVCYDGGAGVEKSPSTAFRFYVASAKAGLPLGMNETGLRYQAGAGTIEDVVAAAGWFALAAQSGNIPSQVNLARMYLQGVGVPRNLSTAVQLYTAAAGAGHPTAAFELGQLNEYGIGMQRDLVRAHALYSMAADFKTEKAAEMRDALSKNMSKEQLSAADLVRKGLPAFKASGDAESKPAPAPSDKPKAGPARTPERKK